LAGSKAATSSALSACRVALGDGRGGGLTSPTTFWPTNPARRADSIALYRIVCVVLTVLGRVDLIHEQLALPALDQRDAAL
jgi:hypothetical protein